MAVSTTKRPSNRISMSMLRGPFGIRPFSSHFAFDIVATQKQPNRKQPGFGFNHAVEEIRLPRVV